ncbi:hypothetical protein PPERSA_10865 [Pseudocohnilembus persalinus]|uniref:Anaphase-promoting complex subunit 5 n=1 Tax=Pseudocohnilembus persalinus TaxID=266149 RepID=A0A0V0QDV6_PSEPJ|nr:hypothetical protein PPERSA_10865 [Pseudocohnilembus persalinus]|eukprot:KRX00366.1 hypothetical protein PPERSA_10865 [Pseudocohnilembus persalinus]
MNKNQVQNFLTPHNISYVILFHEYDLNIQNLRGEDQFKNYLTQKVMNLDSEEPSANYSVFAKNIEKETIQYENASQIIQGYKQRPDQNMNINKVNHILINKASLNFEMGFYDEALRCLTEGLRIAQNNSDDESINYCLTYFYQISSILGKPQDALAIVEHALVHAVKLKNPQLQLISCLNYMNFRSMYVVEENGIQNTALTKKNVIWYETLQQSIRKLIQMYEYNLGNKMVNKEAFLDIPVTLYSLNLANQFLNLQQPQLSMMEYNSRKILYQSTFQSQKAQIYLMEFALKTLEYNPQFSLNQIEEVAKNNKIKLQIGVENYDQAFNLVCKAIQFCKDKGYVNQELTEFQMYKAIIKFRCQDFLEALKDFCEIKIEAKKKKLMELKIQAKIYCALISSQLGNLTKSVNLLRKIENSFLANLSIEIQAFFYKSKAISMIPLALTFEGQDDIRKNMIKEILVQLQKSLEIYINLNSLNDIREIYYLQARIYDDIQMEEHRETSSYFFLVAEELINNFDKEEYQYISLYGVKDLSLIDIQRDFLQTFPSHFKIFEI